MAHASSFAEADDTERKLAVYGIKYRLTQDLIERVWADRPALPDHPLFLHPEEYSGASAKERIEQSVASSALRVPMLRSSR